MELLISIIIIAAVIATPFLMCVYILWVLIDSTPYDKDVSEMHERRGPNYYNSSLDNPEDWQ